MYKPRPQIVKGLSIQGSKYHYCSPKEYLDDIWDYISVEIMVEENLLNGFQNLELLLEYGDFGDVFGYVPTWLAKDIFEFVKGK